LTDDKPDRLETPGDRPIDTQGEGGVTTPPSLLPQERSSQGHVLDVLEIGPPIGSPLREKKVSIPLERERAAKDIAKWLIIAFGGSMAGAFIIVMALIVPTWWADTDTIITKVIPVMNNILEAVKLIGAIFSPLLAFILGYYFSVSTHKDED